MPNWEELGKRLEKSSLYRKGDRDVLFPEDYKDDNEEDEKVIIEDKKIS